MRKKTADGRWPIKKWVRIHFESNKGCCRGTSMRRDRNAKPFGNARSAESPKPLVGSSARKPGILLKFVTKQASKIVPSQPASSGRCGQSASVVDFLDRSVELADSRRRQRRVARLLSKWGVSQFSRGGGFRLNSENRTT